MFNQSSPAFYFPSLSPLSVVTSHVITDSITSRTLTWFLDYYFFLFVSSTSVVYVVLRMPNTPGGGFCSACTDLWLCSSVYMHVCACVSVLGDKSPMWMTDSPLLSAMSRSRPPPHRRGRKVGPTSTRQASAVQSFFLRSLASRPFHHCVCLKKNKKNCCSCFSLTFCSQYGLLPPSGSTCVRRTQADCYLPFQRKNRPPTHTSRRQFMKIRPR